MSNNNDESPNFSINSTQNNTTENIIQAPNLINPITSSEPGFLINSTDANILNDLLGINNLISSNPVPSLNLSNRNPVTTYTTSTTSDQNGISSLITISGNIFNDLSGIEEDSDDDIPELENASDLEDDSPHTTPIENASGEANPAVPFSSPSLSESIMSLESLAMRIASRRRRRNTVHPRNIDLMRFFTNVLADDLEEQIVRQVMRDSFAEDQEKRLIDVARELNIEKEKFDPNKESHKEFCSCRVCLEDYKEGEELGMLPCKHFFHFNCIQEWGKRKPNCPYCDVEIPTVEPETESNKKQKLN